MSEPIAEELEQQEPKEGEHAMPVGWLVLFWGLIAFGVYYLWAYTPGLGGWSQVQDLEGGGARAGADVLATIAFTAVAAIAAAAILLGAARRKR
jgi:hypothetical protein